MSWNAYPDVCCVLFRRQIWQASISAARESNWEMQYDTGLLILRERTRETDRKRESESERVRESLQESVNAGV